MFETFYQTERDNSQQPLMTASLNKLSATKGEGSSEAGWWEPGTIQSECDTRSNSGPPLTIIMPLPQSSYGPAVSISEASELSFPVDLATGSELLLESH
jgi:hypothetical protein